MFQKFCNAKFPTYKLKYIQNMIQSFNLIWSQLFQEKKYLSVSLHTYIDKLSPKILEEITLRVWVRMFVTAVWFELSSFNETSQQSIECWEWKLESETFPWKSRKQKLVLLYYSFYWVLSICNKTVWTQIWKMSRKRSSPIKLNYKLGKKICGKALAMHNKFSKNCIQ